MVGIILRVPKRVRIYPYELVSPPEPLARIFRDSVVGIKDGPPSGSCLCLLKTLLRGVAIRIGDVHDLSVTHTLRLRSAVRADAKARSVCSGSLWSVTDPLLGK